MRVSIVPIYDVAPVFAADTQGYFAAENISISTQSVQGGVIGIPGLVSGGFDVAYSNTTSVITALERGIDLRIISEGNPVPAKPPDPGALLRRKGENLRTGKDFEGKSIGVNALRDIQWVIVRSWVKATGGNPEKVDYREIPLPQMADSIKNKQVDTALLLDPFMTVALGDPALELLDWPLSKVFANGAPAVWVVTGQTADHKAELVRAFLRGFKKGVTWVRANLGKEPYYKLLSSYTRIDPALASKMNFFPPASSINLAAIQRMVALMRDNGLVAGSIDLRSKVFNS